MVLSRRDAVLVFLVFAFTYFFAALVRAVTATLAPTLTAEFELHARDLGLLGGGYFIGFAATQLPLGRWLDAHGPRNVLVGFLGVAAVGCLAFSLASDFTYLLAARVLCGVGLGACLMAPLTGFRRWLSPQMQLRANSWMLMTGSLGMVASTLPVQWLVPRVGWRPVFWVLAALLVVCMVLIALRVPRWSERGAAPAQGSYREVWRHPYFRRMAPVGFFSYGGMLAMQTLWIGPWLVRVAGHEPLESASGLFVINVSMLVAFWSWGLFNPRLAASGWNTDRLITWGMPLSFVAMGAIITAGPAAGAGAWAFFCVTSTFLSLAQPAVGMAFAPALAGRALSAYNLVIFAGVFAVQWGVGLLIDGFERLGLSEVSRFRAALAVFLACSIGAWVFFVRRAPDNPRQ
ncbi:MFS transporter [Ramlibacter rhizophilus]|uniref:MFS transporter n=1 Tax=Ramlibacter rhizophilus TaxID=1781167 RepID=A0A4Z0BDM3_9BURK|nr:MFS transporter [Ramlibacter rhizophilus]TFY96214.1 MFS transporter [Ramlibacter rhizophilus]